MGWKALFNGRKLSDLLKSWLTWNLINKVQDDSPCFGSDCMETTVDRANSPSTASNAIVSAGEHSVVFVHKSAQFQSNLSRGLGILLFQKEHPDFDIKYILLLSFAANFLHIDVHATRRRIQNVIDPCWKRQHLTVAANQKPESAIDNRTCRVQEWQLARISLMNTHEQLGLLTAAERKCTRAQCLIKLWGRGGAKTLVRRTYQTTENNLQETAAWLFS